MHLRDNYQGYPDVFNQFFKRFLVFGTHFFIHDEKIDWRLLNKVFNPVRNKSNFDPEIVRYILTLKNILLKIRKMSHGLLLDLPFQLHSLPVLRLDQPVRVKYGDMSLELPRQVDRPLHRMLRGIGKISCT